MPTYDYDCESCGHAFELFQSISEPAADKCPACGGAVRRRIHGGAGLIFKGSGFYLTDYKKSGNAAGNKPESGPAPEAGGEKAGSEDGKPASDKAAGKSPAETSRK